MGPITTGSNPGDVIRITDLHAALAQGRDLAARIAANDRNLPLRHDLSSRQLELLRAGSIINWLRARKSGD